jgi:hypothetical protein
MRVRAESVQNGINYSIALTAANTSTNSGSGINVGTDSIAAQLVNDAVAQGGKIFAITDAGDTAYAIFGQLITQAANTYFCVDSVGRTSPNTGATSTPTIACQ